MILCLVFAIEPLAAAAPNDGPLSMGKISIGLKGAYQIGRWTPVDVELSGTLPEGSEVQVSTRDADGNRVVVKLEQITKQHFRGVTLNGRIGAPFRIDVTNPANPQQVLLSQTFSATRQEGLQEYRQSTLFWLLVGSHPGFQAAANIAAAESDDEGSPAGDGSTEGARLIHSISMLPEQLPTRTIEYDSIHTIALDRGDLAPEPAEAIEAWVSQGGNLVVVLGKHEATFRNGPLAAWLPVRTLERVVERQTTKLLTSIAVAAPNNARLLSFGEMSVTPLKPLEGASTLPGKVLIDGPGSPVAIRAAHGLGTISVIGIDLAAPPFAEAVRTSSEQNRTAQENPPTQAEAASQSDAPAVLWSGLPKLCLSLAGVTMSVTDDDRFQNSNGLTLSGTSDMQSQWNVIVEDFPQIQRLSSGQVIGLMALILLMIAPIDYFLVHRLLKRPHFTWLTLPLWITAASWMASAVASRRNDAPLEVNQFDVVDVAVDTGLLRSTSWLSFYSPESKRYSVSWQPDEWLARGGSPNDSASAASPTQLFGMQLPEDGFRGMYRQGGMSMAEMSYHVDPVGGRVDQLPVELWSSRALVGEHSYHLPPNSSPIAESGIRIERLRSGGRNLKNWSFVHHLPTPIHDWFIVSESQVIYPSDSTGPLATLEPGREYDLMIDTSKPQLKTFLQGQSYLDVKKNVGTERYLSANAYDPASREPDRFLRTLTFFQGVGGKRYTGLTNQSLNRLDLSEFAHLDRAILFGRIDRPTGELSIDGQPPSRHRSETYIRIVVPVVRETHLQSIADEEKMLQQLKQ